MCFYLLKLSLVCDAVAFFVVFSFSVVLAFVKIVWCDVKLNARDGICVRARHKAKQVIKTTDGHRMKNVNRMACQLEGDETSTLNAEFQLDPRVYGWREHVYTWINVLAHIRQRRSINAIVIGRKAIDEDRFLWVCEKCLKRQKSAIKCIKKR